MSRQTSASDIDLPVTGVSNLTEDIIPADKHHARNPIMKRSTTFLLASLTAAALTASGTVSAHPTDNAGGATGHGAMGSGSKHHSGMMQQHHAGAAMQMQHHQGAGVHHSMKQQRSMHGAGPRTHRMMGADHMGNKHRRGGMRVKPVQHLTIDDVTHFFGHFLERRGNKRLKLGKVVQKDDNTITTEIVTIDDSLVVTYEIDRHSGRVEQIK
jgi:hypothetical protein